MPTSPREWMRDRSRLSAVLVGGGLLFLSGLSLWSIVGEVRRFSWPVAQRMWTMSLADRIQVTLSTWENGASTRRAWCSYRLLEAIPEAYREAPVFVLTSATWERYREFVRLLALSHPVDLQPALGWSDIPIATSRPLPFHVVDMASGLGVPAARSGSVRVLQQLEGCRLLLVTAPR